MPTYDYQCDRCDHRFEQFQSFTDDKLTKCPECGEEALRRLFGTGAAVLFKGSGFYETDYRSDSYKSAEKKESEPSKPSDSGGKSESKTESKPPAKSGGESSPAKSSGD